MPTTCEQVLTGEVALRASRSGARTLILIAVAGVVVSGICVAAVFLSSPRGVPRSTVLIGATTVSRGSARLLVQTSGRAWLVNTKDGLRILQDRCTHCGSRLRWDDARRCFECAADGTLYDVNGLVVRGLTRMPLSELPTRREASAVVVRGR